MTESIVETFEMEIKLLECENKELTETEDFNEWLICKAIECGTGTHYEYYIVSEDSKDDIPVKFNVKVRR